MDLMSVKIWVDIAQFVLTGAIGVWLYLDRRYDRTQEQIDQLASHIDSRLDDHAQRLSGLESAERGGVRHTDLEKLWEAFRQSQSMLHEIKGRQEAANRLLEDLIKYQMNKNHD